MEFDNLHQILRSLYEQMMPPWGRSASHQINSVRSSRQVKQQLASHVSKNALHNFDRIVIVTHCTSPIKVGATVGTAFLHFSPYDESYFGGTTFLVAEVAGNERRKGRVKI